MYMASFKSVINETLSIVKEVEKNFQSFNLVDIEVKRKSFNFVEKIFI